MLILILSGLFSGIISGMGIGGGTILIPALTFFSSLDQHTAQGINLLYFLPTAAVALFVHRKNNAVEWKLAVPVMLFGIIGASLGAWLALAISPTLLRRFFGIFLFFMGGYEIYKGFQKNKT
ncbi:MAG: sulfite exporter TauE/SafE family protein [Clostridia bacterium]|nr:sulfite exporter TauE/SafE family protein [Clostridia bacterium]